MDEDVLSVETSADGSEIAGAERADGVVDTCEASSCARPARVSSTRSAPCEEMPLLAAEAGLTDAERSGVSLRRDPGATKLPISDLSGENRETKIGNVRRAMAGHPLPRFLVSVEFGKRRTTDLDSLMHEVRNDPDLVLWYRLPGIGRAGHRSESTWEPPSASQRACLIRQALFFP